MRILLVSHRFPPDDVGGVERYTQTLAGELVKRGDSVSIAARRLGPGSHEIGLLRERVPDGSVIYRLAGGSFRFERFLANSTRLEQLFTLAVLESEPDVVHVNHLMGLSPRFIHIAHRLGAAVVVSLHDFYFACPRVHLQKPSGELCQGPDAGRECTRTCFSNDSGDAAMRWGLRAMYFRKLLAMAECVIAYSNHVATYFERLAGKPIDVLANGVSMERAACGAGITSLDGILTIAYCGTVAPHKGPHIILEALKLAALPAVKVLVIGNLPDREYGKRLRQVAAEIPGLTLQMYGKYEPNELALLLRGADCVVVPSLVPEAGPIVPREALAQNIPIIVSNLGALPELVVEGENGFTFDPNRPAELAGRLHQMAEDKTLLPRLRAGARRSPVVTISEHAGQIRDIYGKATRDFKSGYRCQADVPDLNFVHDSLVALECDPVVRPMSNEIVWQRG